VDLQEEDKQMEGGSEKRKFTPQEKVKIVLEGLRGDVEVSEICRRYGISTTLFYPWRERMMEFAKEGFARSGRPSGDAGAAKLREELARKDKVIAEITEEILKVKRGLWP
jgi:transposase